MDMECICLQYKLLHKHGSHIRTAPLQHRVKWGLEYFSFISTQLFIFSWTHNFPLWISRLAQVVRLFTCMREVFGSNLNQYSSLYSGLDRSLGPPGCWGHQGCQTIITWRWQGYQPYAPAAFNPRRQPWYLFLLLAQSIPGPKCG